MNRYFTFCQNLKAEYYRNYFLTEFMPAHFPDTSSRYIMFQKESLTPELLKLESTLTEEFEFPKIEYFSIFRHVDDQPVHVDGHSKIRYASLNLALAGYQNTTMKFYSILRNNMEIRDARYYKDEDISYSTEFAATDDWVLVNSGIPHNITGIDPSTPRVTVCIRFVGNPTFKDLEAKLQKKWAAE